MYTKGLERGGEIPSSSPRLKNYRSAMGSLFDYGQYLHKISLSGKVGAIPIHRHHPFSLRVCR